MRPVPDEARAASACLGPRSSCFCAGPVFGVAHRARKARAELARRAAVAVDPVARWLLTEAGRDALARATAEAWLSGAGPSVAEGSAIGAAA
jgi:hypothetical protein